MDPTIAARFFAPSATMRKPSLDVDWRRGPSIQMVVKKCLGVLNIHGDYLGPNALRAAICALEHHADIAKVQEWLGHANISTTQVYDRREAQASESPTFSIVF